MKCYCCGNSTENSNYIDQFIGAKIQFCSNCKHMQILKIPNKEEIANFYNGKYSEDRSSYIGPAYFKIMSKRAEAQIKFVKNSAIDLKNKEIFDIGCGYGFLIEKLLNYSKNVYGLEFDPKTIEFCSKKNLNVIKITDEKEISEKITNGSILFFSHVLEHLTDFDKTFKIISQKAEYIFIEVPAYDYKIKEQMIDQEGHINFFNETSLKTFFEKRNYEIINIQRFGPSLSFFYNQGYLIEKIKYYLRRISNDYFFRMYNFKNNNGIWIRCIVKAFDNK